jgi:molybdenum cofactor biosynthesis enzyme MoaA
MFCSHLVIQVTEKCNKNCYHCDPRQENYTTTRNRDLPLESAKAIIDYAYRIGKLEKLSISGGEPSIMRIEYLKGIIDHAVQLGIPFITCNTNGVSTKDPGEFWKPLLEAGLNNAKLSLDSPYAKTHNFLRSSRVGFSGALNTLKAWSELKRMYPIFNYAVGMVLNNTNIMDTASMLYFCIEHGVSNLSFNYIENDEKGIFSVPKCRQLEFREKIIPQMLSIVGADKNARREIMSIYDPLIIPPELSEKGIYHNLEHQTECNKLGNFLLLKASGEILPCNGAEYSSEENAVIGYVKGEKIEIDLYNLREIEKCGLAQCSLCPIPIKPSIDLRPLLKKKTIFA